MRVNYSVKRDRAGDRIVCGTRHCRGILGRILDDYPNYGPRGGLWLPQGWTYRGDGDYWELSRRALRRLQRGQSADARNTWGEMLIETEVGWLLTFQYPESVRCYQCDLIQSIDADSLGLPIIPILKSANRTEEETPAYANRAIMRPLMPDEMIDPLLRMR